MINITGKEAKKHVAEALKIVFPGFKFSLRSSFDQVLVSWTDGPMETDVQRVLNRFESYTRVLCRTDYKKKTGYEWHGTHYAGPEYLDTLRSFSDEHRAALVEAAGSMKIWIDLNKTERVEIERELIRTGKLEGVEPRQCPDLLIDEKPVLDNRPKKQPEPIHQQPSAPNNVVQLFPGRVKNQLTPEQMLKAHILDVLSGKQVMQSLVEAGDGKAVDVAFTLAAAKIYTNLPAGGTGYQQ
ncbi:LPD29 domain-containing protein [Paenibacillus taichungensis]|uniref:LPD29 domain-containing protein n=1 Tax=Paenibacillus taichungensis TaxID=484184 RepID=UPI0035DB6A3E